MLMTAVGLLGPAARAAPALAPIHRVETAEPAVAITFDACATRTHGYGFDRAVYDVLKHEGVPATIFVSGRWVEFHAAEMAELARDPLIAFGDHSYDHPHMSRLARPRMGEEIDQTEAALARYGKKSVAFRPPFGDWSRRMIEVAHERGLPTVTWDVVSGDPSARTTKAGMIRNVVGRARAGSIVIFHINGRGRKTAEALPEILRELRGRGLHSSRSPTCSRSRPRRAQTETVGRPDDHHSRDAALARAQATWIVGIEPWRSLGYEATPLGSYLARMAKEREVWIARGEGRGGKPLGLVVVQDGFLLGAFVSLLAVRPEAAGQGVGRALMEHVAAGVFAKRPWLFVSCDAANVRALAFYRKLGFARVGRLPDLIKPKRVEILLRKGALSAPTWSYSMAVPRATRRAGFAL